MSTGTTVQVIGAVVDVEFPAGQIPKIYDALIIDEPGITLEVQQQLGDGVVRTIAMGSSEGLKRGMSVTVLPTPAPPNKPTLPPLEIGMIRSITLMPVSRSSVVAACSS